MPAQFTHVGRKFTHESAKLERRRKKEERRRQRIDERPKQQEEIFKLAKLRLGPDATVIRRLAPTTASRRPSRIGQSHQGGAEEWSQSRGACKARRLNPN
jgi:hypothetical protein